MRNLEREIGTICRKLAREVAEAANGSRKRFTVNVKRVHDLLGRPRAYSRGQAAHQRRPAWPPASPGRRSAATSSSSRRRPCPATAASPSPASSAT